MMRLGMILGAMAIAACGELSDLDDLTDAGAPVASLDPGELDGDGEAAVPALSFAALQHGGQDLVPLPALQFRLWLGANRIVDLQADILDDNAHNGLIDTDPDDGGWDFILPGGAPQHTPNPSPTNIFGATALGPWAALQAGVNDRRFLISMLDAGLGTLLDPAINSGPDFVFGVLLSERIKAPWFAWLARIRYDIKRAANGGALGLGLLIRNSRHASNNDGLIPYDLSWMALGAAALDAAFPGAGYDADADLYMQIVLDDLLSPTPFFNVNDPFENFYITGLAWANVAATWRGADLVAFYVRLLLIIQQQLDGAWGTNATDPAPNLQSTAHALQTLALTDALSFWSRQAMDRGALWLLLQQRVNGGWVDANNLELPLVEADILLGLMLSQTKVGISEGLIPDAPFLTAPGATTPARPLASPLD